MKIVLVFFILTTVVHAEQNHQTMHVDTAALVDTHDLISLPNWGPYTKKYIGVSHIPDMDKGIRFDLSVFPGFYRRKVMVPNVFFESGYHPWESSGDFNYFSFRHEMEWKDDVYADISYSKINDQARLIRAEFVNNTDLPQNVVLHYMASIHFPPIKEYSPYTPIHPARVRLPEGVDWIDALDYQELQFAVSRPRDNLVYDGKLRGEIRDHGFVNGSGLGRDFGRDPGDWVSYLINIEQRYENPVLLIRYRMSSGSLALRMSGIAEKTVTLDGEQDFALQIVELPALDSGQHNITLTSLGGAPVELDGLILMEADQVNELEFEIVDWHPVPEILDGPLDNSILLKYKDIDLYYGLVWNFDLYQVRQFFNRDLDVFFRRLANTHVRNVFHGDDQGHFTNVFMRPVLLDPRDHKVVHGMICSGHREEVEDCIKEFDLSENAAESIYQNARQNRIQFTLNPSGEKYLFSQQRMAATTLGNVVYPVYTQRSYIKHHTPGRWWDCLYTWDSGFIGLGLLELDMTRAIECLNAYLTDPGDQSAFIHHGTPVPVQFYLFLELWNQTQSEKLLKFFYPRLKQYYLFMAGKYKSSTTRELESNLLQTWDYFYNTGWDDYPPQQYLHEHNLTDRAASVIMTAHVIRIAKIMHMAAKALGLKKDIQLYEQDIQTFTRALQTHAWDQESGYYGYVMHNESGQPTGILHHPGGKNFNMGLGGVYPLVAGICTNDQKAKMMDHLTSGNELWTPIGLTAVDQSAPYYRMDGYWNGAVWMPHQWFFWKTMLDINEPEFAHQIAGTALDVWKNEVEASYNCFEHFLVKTGRGAGWHEFGGLSAPVLCWFNAYHQPGRLTTGFDVWVEKKSVSDQNSFMQARLKVYPDRKNKTISLIACMNPNYGYTVTWNDKACSVNPLSDGVLEIQCPVDTDQGFLRIVKKL